MLSDEIFEALTKDILSGVLAPGQRLDEPSICRKFGVSRTPIREALRRLSGMGLVDFAPRRGVTVARIAVEQLTDMIEALAEFEGLCARLAAVRMTGLEKRRLEFLNANAHAKIANGEQNFPSINIEFHESIYQGAHSTSIASVTRSFRQRLAPFRPLQFVPGQTELSFRDHDKIARAIIASNSDEAYRAMRDHITGTGLQIIEHFQRREASAPPEKAASSHRKAG